MPLIIEVLMYLVGGYAAVVGLMFFAQRRLMYPAGGALLSPADVGLAGVREIDVKTADGLSLRSWFMPPQSNKPTIVYFHGNAGTIADRAYKARLFADQGFGVLLMEYRGYGGNPGSPTEQGLYDDGRANLDWLADEGQGSHAVVLYGESLGTGVATHLAWELAISGKPASALILEAPFTSMADAAQHHYRFLPAGILTRDRYDSKAKISDIQAPLLIIHGRLDTTVPDSQGRRLLAMADDPKHGAWLDQAGHNDVYDHGAGRFVLEFLAEQDFHSKR